MTITNALQWIKDNASPYIVRALNDYGSSIYTEEWLAGITMQETGFLIIKLVSQGHTPAEIWPLLKGDYNIRPGEDKPTAHGYGPVQCDIGSFPEFITSGQWQDPYKCYNQALHTLEGDRIYLQHHYPFKQIQTPDDLARAITAAYNCGAGKERDILNQGLDFDAATYGHNYSALVWQYRNMYKTLQS